MPSIPSSRRVEGSHFPLHLHREETRGTDALEVELAVAPSSTPPCLLLRPPGPGLAVARQRPSPPLNFTAPSPKGTWAFTAPRPRRGPESEPGLRGHFSTSLLPGNGPARGLRLGRPRGEREARRAQRPAAPHPPARPPRLPAGEGRLRAAAPRPLHTRTRVRWAGHPGRCEHDAGGRRDPGRCSVGGGAVFTPPSSPLPPRPAHPSLPSAARSLPTCMPGRPDCTGE